MAAETQVRGTLMGQHVSVVGAVDFVTGRAALDSGSLVFMKERTALVGVAADALFILEPAQARSCRGGMLVMAGGAFEDSFLQPMAFIHFELSADVLVAGEADF